jgi:hypothetical protein
MAQVHLGRFEAATKRLPQVCVVCGESATARVRKNFVWHPLWVSAFLWLGLPFACVGLPSFVVLSWVFTKRMMVSLPFCRLHKNHWSKRTVYTMALLLLMIAVGAGELVWIANGPSQRVADFCGFVFFSWLTLALIWLIGAVIINGTAIQPAEITESGITLRGVSETFADEVVHQELTGVPTAMPVDGPHRPGHRLPHAGDPYFEPRS